MNEPDFNQATVFDSHDTLDRRKNQDRRKNGPAPWSVGRIFNTRQACDYLQISRPTLMKLIHAGRIHAKKIGKGWKLAEAELRRLLGER
ncbi:MAG: helix-turn-helix domain-containing protein [Desulfobacterales bacterium]|jgi:excisionase family DNA binding protein|nr:helix-turn-helix domain-containing protein [Desulfobacterales bacterium]